MNKDHIKVVVCGDDGVGKTSLITTLLRDEFIPNIQNVLPPVTILKNFSTKPYLPKSTILVDTTNDDMGSLHSTLKSADVIWLVYSNHESYERIALHWMMMFRSLGLNLPVILCKNKCDKYDHAEIEASLDRQSEGEGDTKIEDAEFIPILMEFKEVETCIKTSALRQYNVIQAFYLCQRSINFPISPLFDARKGTLKSLAIHALERIFLLCDNDQDNYLNDTELLALQRKCFGKNIDFQELADIKQTLWQVGLDDTHEKLFEVQKGITKAGFLTLNKLYCEKGRHETVWHVLRAFKYTDSLSLDNRFLYPKITVSESSSVELSPKGYRFLVDLFLKFDKDNDGGLCDEELAKLFQCTPGIPKSWSETDFPNSSVINNKGFITLQGWLAQWTMTTFLDYKTTTAYLVYFGFEEDTKVALQVTRPRKFRRRSGKFYRADVNDRKVFSCLVVGKPNSGKTSLLESFLGRAFPEKSTSTDNSRIAVNSLELKGGKQYYLVLQEYNEDDEKTVLKQAQKFSECDVICMTYDSSDPESFSYIIDLFDKYGESIKNMPVIFVALKADLDKQQQRSSLQPDEYTDSLSLDHPLHVSSTWLSSLNELFVKVTEAALTPAKFTPGLTEEMKTNNDIDYKQTAVIIGSTIGFISLLSFTLAKVYRASRHN
ncbi:hypothetical protein KAFR_0I00240 [Kazachstania africana CBS 2517]|uniref:Mitochondrial Rho GTPase n=1 Tax=Kazachstania africana (strain ATCC 22294 / BCRC 22015 / CBS 2517 / CECT 1963 / NBRC 1671 / NRRL Y-8276) TaxID=1071382 RepID=H2AZK5_KAZAF|nr:hypothetical protein KAFR_0I00240 [Kazachstania africana CBS 2517]CCF59805.1 hypothetical protein KAFR_0I00240 [Kazachstania africana CBS 2517]